MSQLAQLSEAELEERFHITGRRAIALTLEGLARAGERFTVHFGQELMLTTLLAANAERGELVFDRGGSEILNRHLLDWGQCTFVARPEGVLVQFAVEEVSPVSYAGRLALVAQLPPFILRLQRREYFRLQLPSTKPYICRIRRGAPQEKALPLHDISVGGVGIHSPQPLDYEQLEKLENSWIDLHDSGVLAVTLEVRYVNQIESRTGRTLWHLGCRFVNLSPLNETLIQRFMARLEAERKALAA